MKTKEVMKVLAKILSIFIIILSIWQLFLFRILPPYALLEHLPGIILRFIIFYTPLFYFAWSKKNENKIFRVWGKIISILLALYLLVSVFAGIIYGFLSDIIGTMNPLYFITNILLVVFLGYFSWFDKDKPKKR